MIVSNKILKWMCGITTALLGLAVVLKVCHNIGGSSLISLFVLEIVFYSWYISNLEKENKSLKNKDTLVNV
jgi:hypothetical protein